MAVGMRKHLGEADTRLLEILACTFDKGMIHTITLFFLWGSSGKIFHFSIYWSEYSHRKILSKTFWTLPKQFCEFLDSQDMWVQSAVGLNGLLHGFYAFSSTSLRPTTRTRSTNEGQCQCVGWEGRRRNSGRGDPRALPASGCCDRSFAPQSSSVSLCRRPLPLQRVIRGPSFCCYWCCVKSLSIFQS